MANMGKNGHYGLEDIIWWLWVISTLGFVWLVKILIKRAVYEALENHAVPDEE